MSQRIQYDHYFTQWLMHALPRHGLEVHGKPQFSDLPLEADVLVIAAPQEQIAWKQHPLWKHCSPYTVIEFKSIADAFRRHHLETLTAYVALTHRKYKLPLGTEVAGWLVVEYINKALRDRLAHYEVQLEPISQGIWFAQTSFYLLWVIEYRHLPNTADYFELKTFMDSGDELIQAMRLGLKTLEGSLIQDEYLTIVSAIHKQEAEAVIEILESEKQNLAEVINHALTKFPYLAQDIPIVHQYLEAREHEIERKSEQKGKLEGKLEEKFDMATKLHRRGEDLDTISDLTGLNPEQIGSFLKEQGLLSD